MPEAQLTEPLDHAVEKRGVKELFAALEAAVKADVARTRRRECPGLDPLGRPRALATASQAAKVIGAHA